MGKNKIAVGTKQVICHEIGIVGRKEHLTWQFKEFPAHFVCQSEMIEGIELINEYKGCTTHFLQPNVKNLQ